MNFEVVKIAEELRKSGRMEGKTWKQVMELAKMLYRAGFRYKD